MSAFLTRASLFTLCLTAFSLSSFSQTVYTLDWASSFGTWTDGQTSGNATNIGGSGVNCSVSMTKSGGIFSLTASTSIQTPTVSGAGFYIPGSTAGMRINMDFTANTQYTDVVYTFSTPISGIKFNVVDIDKASATATSYFDRIAVTGSNGVSTYYPVVSKYVVSSNVLGSVGGNTATANTVSNQGGNSASTNADQTGTVMVDFGTATVKTITIHYDNGAGADADPANQAIAIGNLSFLRINLPPVSNNFSNFRLLQGAAATAIPGLSAADADGTIASYTITSVPTAAQGVLSVPCPATPTGATCTGGYADLTPAVLSANGNAIVLTPAQAAGMRFDPASTFNGTASFTFTATDNMGAVSNAAVYSLPLTAQPPVSNNIMENSLINTAAATAIQPLSSSDVDGTISTYNIISLPTVAQGVLSVPCPTTFTGAACTGGYQDLTATVLGNYPSGISLTAAQMAAMKFDPAAGYVGNASFTYNATDNSGNTGNTANYTIPVAATVTSVRPPLAENIVAQTLNNSLGATSIPALQAADLDGSITSYTITSLPTGGTLYCCGGSAVTSGQTLTPAQISTLQFDPLATFTGTASFSYTATDNTTKVSNTATYSIPVVNRAPVATNLSATLAYNAAATAISPLSGFDADGTITSYTITSVPTAAQGVLSVNCPPTLTGGTCTGGYQDLTPAVLTANSSAILLTAAQAASLRFDPAAGFTGTASFAYTVTDNNANVSAAAIYNLMVDAQPPVSTDVTNATLANSAAATAITGLNGTDADGTVTSYLIQTLPTAAQGVLSIPCPATLTGATCTGGYQDLTQTILNNYPDGLPLTTTQAAGMKFDPVAGYTGMASFTFESVDNSGFTSNVAIYNIPVSGTGNITPVAKNVTATAMSNGAAATAIAGLVGTDADGTIASYTLTSIPAALQGVLSVPCPTTFTGATCTGGYQDLTAAVFANYPAGISLTTAQAAGMKFDPALGFTGTVNFSYTTTDNSGGVSYQANYSIPVTGVPPVATSITVSALSQTAAATAISGLSATDADGTIANYYLESLPTTAQGVLSVPCPTTFTGATCTGGYQDLTAAVLANYPTGIPLSTTQAAAIKFDPAATYSGNVVVNYHASDNSGMISNSASYTIPVTGLFPVSNNVTANKVSNSAAATAISGLSSTDADGAITSYVITSLPATAQGVLSVPCPATPTGATCTGGYANLTAAVLTANPGGIALTPTQAAGLKFDPAAGFVGDAFFNYAAYDNTGNLSNVAAYSIPVGGTTTLASSLLNFSGERKSNDIVLNWKATNEAGLDRYEIEWSTDGVSFATGGSATAKNTASSSYGLTLYNYTAPVYYLRLKAVEVAGRTSYSNVVVVRLDGALINSLSTHPNPVANKMFIRLTSTASGASTVRILNMVGATVYQQKQPVVKGDNLFSVSDLNVAAGSYLLQVNVNGVVLSQKFVVQK